MCGMVGCGPRRAVVQVAETRLETLHRPRFPGLLTFRYPTIYLAEVGQIARSVYL